MYKKILLAIDKSDYSKKAIDHVKEIAQKFTAEVILLNSYKIPADITDKSIMYHLSDADVNKLKENIGKHYQELLDNTKKEFDSAGIRCTTLLQKGKPGPNIVETSSKENCDLVVLGSRGLGAITGTVLGSVSSYVLHHIDTPLLVVR